MARPKSDDPEVKFKAKLNEYAEKYDLDDLRSANDRSNLHTLINYELAIDALQTEMRGLLDDPVSNLQQIALIDKTLASLVDNKLRVEKSLSIDRQARKKDVSTESPAEYIISLKQAAKNFLEKKLTKVYCTDCNVMVLRFSPVHDHVKFDVRVRCSQCNKMIVVKREDKDIFYDLKATDREWRKEHPVEIIQPKEDGDDEIDSVDDDLVIG